MLETITLEQLNSRDAMMTRVDRKYLIRHSHLELLLDGLPAGTRVLDIAGTTRQRYTTVYYDTPDLRCYHDAAYRRRLRFKVRTRTYEDTGVSFLEVKTKGPRGVTVKQRTLVDATPASWLAHSLGGRLREGDVDKLAPVLTNTYRRMTLSPPDAGRATIDTDLTWTSGSTLEGLDLVFVETKSTATPSSIDRLLWSRGHRPVSVSKFGCGMAALHPELPAGKWTRTLNRHFERTTSHA